MTNTAETMLLAEIIRSRLLGIPPDEQDVSLEDGDWHVILAALEADAIKALRAMLDHYGPPASVADMCEYDHDHPISLARAVLATPQQRTGQ